MFNSKRDHDSDSFYTIFGLSSLEDVKERVHRGERLQKEMDPSLGEKMWPLVSDWSWIHRRVESVRLDSNGDTRRHISFDFTIPQSSVAAWYSTDPRTQEKIYTDMVIVPLSFLKKGTMVNLDLQDASGASLPSLSFSQNGTLTFNAFLHRITELEIDKIVCEVLGDRLSHKEIRILLALGIYDLIHNSVMGEVRWGEREVNVDMRQKFFDFLLGKILDSVDNLDGNETSLVENYNERAWSRNIECSEIGREQNGKIETLLEELGHDDVKEDFFPFSIRFLYWSIDYSIRVSCEEFYEGSGSINPQCSTQSIREILLNYARLVSLLGTVCTSYLFTTLVPHERNLKENDESGECSDMKQIFSRNGYFKPFNRTIIKFSCDTDMSSIVGAKEFENESGFRKQFRELWQGKKGNIGQRKTLVRFTGWSARSTHLEIQYPETTSLYKIERLLPPGEEGGGKKVKNIKFRTSSNRIHLTEHRDFRQPVVSLQVQLGPERTWNAILASLWSTLVSCICLGIGIYGLCSMHERCSQSPEITLDNHLGLASLTFAVMFASYFTTSKHDVAKECWSPTEFIISLSFFFSLLSPVCLWLFSLSHFQILKWILAFFLLIIPVLLSFFLLYVSIMQYRYLTINSGHISSRDENEIDLAPNFVKIEDSVMSVTETGAYNTDLLVYKADRKISLEQA